MPVAPELRTLYIDIPTPPSQPAAPSATERLLQMAREEEEAAAARAKAEEAAPPAKAKDYPPVENAAPPAACRAQSRVSPALTMRSKSVLARAVRSGLESSIPMKPLTSLWPSFSTNLRPSRAKIGSSTATSPSQIPNAFPSVSSSAIAAVSRKTGSAAKCLSIILIPLALLRSKTA